jgi:signal transduction histidine kinase
MNDQALRAQSRKEVAMRKAAILSALVSVPLLWNVTLSSAQTTGTAAEAKAMLEKAVAALKANEADALAKFPKTDGGFRDRDLYVYCFNATDGKFTAHVNPALPGTDIRALKDAKDGSPLGQKIFDSVKDGSFATVAYNFPKPGGTEAVPKEAYVTKVGNQGCGVGYYK